MCKKKFFFFCIILKKIHYFFLSLLMININLFDMSEEEKRKQKQNFLREEIMEKEHNPADFAEFLAGERENGKLLIL